jgi:hypothetical protein
MRGLSKEAKARVARVARIWRAQPGTLEAKALVELSLSIVIAYERFLTR